MKTLIAEVKRCVVCAACLPNPPRPVFSVHSKARILIIGQAPGQKVHLSGVPWEDLSGNELRRWLDVTREQFYDTRIFALMPMGFCYPGKGRSGDLPPRSECAPLWHARLRKGMRDVRLTLLIGQYSQNHYLDGRTKPTLTETVKSFCEHLPEFLPLVHPSPRNKIWQKKNPWFETGVVPELRNIVRKALR